MRLSEAIRLGSMASEKCIKEMVNAKGCALGAAGFAIGITQPRHYMQICRFWPWMRKPLSLDLQPPEYGAIENACTLEVIVYLNDIIGWSREQIADWVATIEPPEPEQPSELRVEQSIRHVTEAIR